MNEHKLFYADSVIEILEDLEIDGGNVRIRNVAQKTINQIVDLLKQEPTIEFDSLPIVKELRTKLTEYEPIHAHWINPHWKNSVSCADCSNCGRTAYHYEFHGVQKNYTECPYCGAKMDEEE